MKLAVQLIFWTLAYFVLISIFAGSEWKMIDHIYTSIFLVTILVPVTINDMALRPRLLNRRKYWQYFLLLISVVLAGAWMNDVLFDKLIDYVLPGYYFISYYEYLDLLKFFVSFTGVWLLVCLSMEWFQLQEKKAHAEFQALSNQVNPHFLFNSLTVLYTLSLRDSKETSSAIIKLSDILRYVIYQSSQAAVALVSEAKIIRDYVDLQRYRVHPSTRIEISETLSNETASVSPMLFLPLVENSFKHGVHGETENAFVSILLEEEKGVINFTIANNKPAGQKMEGKGGIGLKNLQDRLLLIYPGRHKFTISETDTTFNIRMQITT
ncbi:MAG TPA: sensor histidine kinase [Cyclobacteriaceae bacterium]|nr:sensor histidine kinase [Cyclobacteriaceae bacterium]